MEAPPPFLIGSTPAVPANLQALEYNFHADISRGVVSAVARVDFQISQAGCPIFDMVPVPLGIRLNGQALQLNQWKVGIPPDQLTQLRVLEIELSADTPHQLEIEYQLWDSVKFSDGGVSIGFFMTDVEERGYLERFGPANLEFDQVPITLNVTLSGDSAGHRVFANGKVERQTAAAAWQIRYPDYYTCSSCYFHLTHRGLDVKTGGYQSSDGRQIPITVYGEAGSSLNAAFIRIPGILNELEARFGAYAHEQLLIYFLEDELGGMEYAGAAMAGPHALLHEITHSWFARGVMPANGNAGWIDEAIAEWQDRGYFRVDTVSQRSPVKLSGFSAYRRHTPVESYMLGSQLLAELDRLFAPTGGLLPLLAKLFQTKKRQLITSEYFKSFLGQHTTLPLDPIFDRYVYGDANAAGFPQAVVGSSILKSMQPDVLKMTSIPKPPASFSLKKLRSLL